MPLSHYLKTFPAPNAPGHTLLFSTRTTALVQLPDDTLRRLHDNESVPESLSASLAKMGLLVADPVAELAEVQAMQARLDELSPGPRLSIILGLACNFACPYCYEGSLKAGQAMSEATAQQIVPFLASRLRPGMRRLVADFYGGEPLLYLPRLQEIAGQLKALAGDQGLEFAFTLVSNGSLLSRETVARLRPLGLKSVKVTVDGPADCHNQSRPFASGAASFDRILANLVAICDLVPITLGGNFTEKNWQRFPELLDILTERGLGPDKIASLKFDPVMAVNDPFAETISQGGVFSTAEPWLMKASLTLRDEVLGRGYRQTRLAPAVCMVDKAESFTIDWDGKLYKCVTLIGHPDCVAGDIWQGFGDLTPYQPQRWRQHQDCPDCVYLPLCFGGCRYSNYQQSGAMTGIDCQRPYFDAALAETIAQDLRHRHDKMG